MCTLSLTVLSVVLLVLLLTTQACAHTAGSTTQFLTDSSWVHVSRAAPSYRVSLLLALQHSDRRAIEEKFASTFDPQHEEYLQYPEEEQVKIWMAPSEEVKRQLNEWINKEICSSSSSSGGGQQHNEGDCSTSTAPFGDTLTITMSTARWERYLTHHSSPGRIVELHSYTHSITGRMHVRSALTHEALLQYIPHYLRVHIAYTEGLADFPLNMHDDEIQRGPPISNDTEHRSRVDVAAGASSFIISNSTVLPNSTSALLGLVNMATSNNSVWISVWYLYCSVDTSNPYYSVFTWPVYIDRSESPYCNMTNMNNQTQIFKYQSVIVTLTETQSNTTIQRHSRQWRHLNGTKRKWVTAPYFNIPTPNNYIGYEVTLTSMWKDLTTNETMQVSDLYPFRLSPTQLIRPHLIRSYMNLPDDFAASENTTHVGIGAFYENWDDELLTGFYSPDDLAEFWSQNNLTGDLPRTSYIDISINGSASIPNNASQPDGETTLDIQFSTGMMNHPDALGTVYHTRGFYSDVIDKIFSLPQVERPQTLSFSYGLNEWWVSQARMNHTNMKFATIGLLGVSVFISSGDDGAYRSANGHKVCSEFATQYPATSPYVTSVGASALKSDSSGQCPTLVQCSIEYGTIITAGGGFSQLTLRSPWQDLAINTWLNSSVCAKPAYQYYDPQYRSVPDIVLFGHAYSVILSGQLIPFDGTSASAPAMAGIFAVVMEKRRLAGLKPLGFLNYLLYQAYAADPRSFVDITQGSNRCLGSKYGCCDDGYDACPGFDPVTGLGQPNFRFLQTALGVNLTGIITNQVEWCDNPAPEPGPQPQPQPHPTPDPIPTPPSKSFLWVYVGVSAGVGLILLAVLIFFCRRRALKQKNDSLDEALYVAMPGVN